MSNESASSSKRTRRATAPRPGTTLDQPFEASLLKQAASIASRYRILMEREEAECVARGIEFPSVFASAPTPNECEAKIREMLTIAVATMLEMGETPPLPASKRRVQVNIRLSGDEKMMLEESAQQAGFRGLSEFVRFAALAYARGTPGERRSGRNGSAG